MGKKLAHFILTKRLIILIVVLGITSFMWYVGKNVDLRYQMPRLLPSDHKAWTDYLQFKEDFGADGFQVLVAVQDDDFYTLKKYNNWKKLGEDFKKLKGIDSVYSEANMYILEKDDSLKKFHLKPLYQKEVNNQVVLDSLKKAIRNYPFYKGTLYNDSTHFHVMILTVNQKMFDSKERGAFVNSINKQLENHLGIYKSDFYLTGLPFIRASNMNNIKMELRFFLILSLITTILVLFFFFKSFRVIGVASLIVGIGVIWTMGLIGLFGYEITAIMGLLPPLIIVIGIPNCVYLITKYQQVYIQTSNKELALRTIIIKIGHITLLTNATTALGLGTFIFTDTPMLVEFGKVASIGIILLFCITLLMVPILFSYLPEPKAKQTKHLEKTWLLSFLSTLEHIALNKRRLVYICTIIIIGIGIYGASRLKAAGKLMDDLPNGDKVKTDLVYFQENLAGIMPFEVVLNFKKKGKYQSPKVLQQIDSLQNYLQQQPEISKTLSIVDALKFVNQAFYSGNPEKYELPSNRDKGFIKKYVDNNNENGSLSINSYVDSTKTKVRISAHVNDLGIEEVDQLLTRVDPIVNEMFNPDKAAILSILDSIDFNADNKQRNLILLDSLFTTFPQLEFAYIAKLKEKKEEDLAIQWYDNGIDKLEVLNRGKEELYNVAEDTFIGVSLTGFTVPFTKGTNYLIFNLFISLIIAVFGIALLMYFLFKSSWMVLITIITNLIPLIITAGIMGLFNIPLKPSTILVFSISLGIAVDDAIHYLAKFKQELKNTEGDVLKSVLNSLKETGISMLYTSIILFFGFFIFIASNYGGTQALGLLISVTLLVAMLSNLVLLPALLLSFKNKLEK